MKNVKFIFVPLLLFSALIYSQDSKNMDNPFYKKWTIAFETPPFNDIKVEHFMPAYGEGMKQHKSSMNR